MSDITSSDLHDIRSALYSKTGGFIKGICHPTDEYVRLTDAGAVIYCWRDSHSCFFCGEPDCPCETAWGLTRCDGSAKPAYNAVKKVFTIQ